ncbi:hypothetical protein Lal_00029748 [Lupinus albus]|nr:hypothetical protein Lal_00029748 [Lupinus albus]
MKLLLTRMILLSYNSMSTLYNLGWGHGFETRESLMNVVRKDEAVKKEIVPDFLAPKCLLWACNEAIFMSTVIILMM